MIDQEKVKKFWDSRARRLSTLPPESIANLEENPQLLDEKIRDEQSKVFDWLPDLTGRTVLDLGSGTGQWTFRFCDRGARKVTAVEYSRPMSEIAEQQARARGMDNVEFIVSSAERYTADKPFDVIFISGLFVYLNDDQADALVRNIPAHCHPDTIVILRDGTGVQGRHEINGKYSENLDAEYSAVYRSAAEYLDLFASAGLSCRRHDDMFAPGSPLNKYPETRLRLYEFRLS